MQILALDSSSSMASIAVLDYSHKEVTSLFHYDQPQERTNSSAFFYGLEQALKQTGNPDRIIVGLGPGSYNGLRASIVAARGIASAATLELYGVSSALAIEEKEYWIAGDARGGEYWLAAVRDHAFIQEPHLLAPEAILEKVTLYPDFPFLAYASLPKLPASLKVTLKTPNATILAHLGKKASLPTSLEPLYLKSPHITLPHSS